MNPNDEVQRARLAKAIEVSYKSLEPFRWLNKGLVEEYSGSGYGRRGVKQETIINLSNQTVNAYLMALVANCPRVQINSPLEERRYFSKRFTQAMNSLIQEIDLESTLWHWVQDAYFCVGIVKIHLAESGYVQLSEDLWVDPGKPFASNVSLDNWVHDASATKWGHVQYAGDCYRIPFADLSGPMFFREVVDDLRPTSKHTFDGERLEQMSRGDLVDDDEVEPMIDLADIWMPRDRKIYTFPVDNRSRFQIKSKPVAVLDWNERELSPYEMLCFDDVPENIMPASVAAQHAALERLANNLMRKQKRQSMRQKDITTYTPAGASDAQKIQKSDDGEMIQVNDPSQIQNMKMGGVDQANMAFLINVIDMHNRMAGNVSGMLGLGPQANTVGQEQIIQQQISAKEAQMQYRVRKATNRLVRTLARLLWDDRAKVIPGRLPIEGADGYSLDATWTPNDRDGSFFDYQTEIDVYSMQYQSPPQRIGAIQQLITQIYAPLAQQLQAQGGQLNLQKLTDLFAEMLNLPQLKECVQFVAPLGQDDSQDAGPSPASTTRTYQRNSVSAGPTPHNAARMDAAQWMAMAQPSMNGNGAAH